MCGSAHLKRDPKWVTTSGPKHQSAPSQHGHDVEHITRHERRGGAQGNTQTRVRWTKMMSKLPYDSAYRPGLARAVGVGEDLDMHRPQPFGPQTLSTGARSS